MPKQVFTDDTIRDFHAQYLALGTEGVQSFAKRCGISGQYLWRRFRRLGLEVIPLSITQRKFPINEDFFETIDTEEKAYVLGFIFADGCNDETHHKVIISLNKKDIGILKAISRLILFGEEHVLPLKKVDMAVLSLISQKLSDDLKKWGGVARKTFVLKFPDIPAKLHHHFIRGYFDGDGMLTYHQRLVDSYKEFDFSIVSTIEMLSAIRTKLERLGVHVGMTKRHKDSDSNNYTLRVSGNQHIKTVCDYLYADATIFLQRKHELYLELVEYATHFRVNDEEFLSVYYELKKPKLIAAKLEISCKTVGRRMKKLGLV
jgi:hypothetical protein